MTTDRIAHQLRSKTFPNCITRFTIGACDLKL